MHSRKVTRARGRPRRRCDFSLRFPLFHGLSHHEKVREEAEIEEAETEPPSSASRSLIMLARSPSRPSRNRQGPAPLRIARWLHLARGHPSRRARCARTRSAPSLRAPPSHRTRAARSARRRARPHRAQARVRRRHGRGRDRTVVSLVQACHQCPATSLSHSEMRRRARTREPVAFPNRTASRGPPEVDADEEPIAKTRARGGYRPWAELLKRTFGLMFCNAPSATGA